MYIIRITSILVKWTTLTKVEGDTNAVISLMTFQLSNPKVRCYLQEVGKTMMIISQLEKTKGKSHLRLNIQQLALKRLDTAQINLNWRTEFLDWRTTACTAIWMHVCNACCLSQICAITISTMNSGGITIAGLCRTQMDTAECSMSFTVNAFTQTQKTKVYSIQLGSKIW